MLAALNAVKDLVDVRALLDWLGLYTYVVVFVGTLIDAIGIPFPGRLLLVAAGALAAPGNRSVTVIIALGAAAAMLVDQVWYLAGARGSERVLAFYRRLTGGSRREDKAAIDYFTRYGAATIVLGRFFTGVRALAWPVAARHGIGYARFFVLDLFAALLWTSIWVLLGWMMGHRWMSAAETAGVWLAVAGVVAMAIVVAPFAMSLWRRRQRRRRAYVAR